MTTKTKTNARKAPAAPVAPAFAAHITAVGASIQTIAQEANAFAARELSNKDVAVFAEIDNAAIDMGAAHALKLTATQRMRNAMLRGVACGFSADELKARALAAFYRAGRLLEGHACTVEQAMQDCADKAELDDNQKRAKKTAGQNVWRATKDAGQVELNAALECDKANGGNEETAKAIVAKPVGAFYKPTDTTKADAGAKGGKQKSKNEGTGEHKEIVAPVAVDFAALCDAYKAQLLGVVRHQNANAGIERKQAGEAFIKAEKAFHEAARAFLGQVNVIVDSRV